VTEILFYTFADNPLDVARRVAAKAYGQGRQVMIYAPDAATADAIDRLLWTTPALGFVPHCRDSDTQADETPVLIGANPESPIVALIYGFTFLFLFPFEGMVATPSAGSIVLELSSLFAMLIYALIAWVVERTVWVLFYRPRGPVVGTTQTTTSERHINP